MFRHVWWVTFFIHTQNAGMYQDLGQDNLRYLLPEFGAHLHRNPTCLEQAGMTPSLRFRIP